MKKRDVHISHICLVLIYVGLTVSMNRSKHVLMCTQTQTHTHLGRELCTQDSSHNCMCAASENETCGYFHEISYPLAQGIVTTLDMLLLA